MEAVFRALDFLPFSPFFGREEGRGGLVIRTGCGQEIVARYFVGWCSIGGSKLSFLFLFQFTTKSRIIDPTILISTLPPQKKRTSSPPNALDRSIRKIYSNERTERKKKKKERSSAAFQHPRPRTRPWIISKDIYIYYIYTKNMQCNARVCKKKEKKEGGGEGSRS